MFNNRILDTKPVPEKILGYIEARRERYIQHWNEARIGNDTEYKLQTANTLSSMLLTRSHHAHMAKDSSQDGTRIFTDACMSSVFQDAAILEDIVAIMSDISSQTKKAAMDKSITKADLIAKIAVVTLSHLKAFKPA